MSTEDQNRVCPTCNSRGTCSRSHKRGMGEEVLALILPVIKPYRCRACNWRGYMGVMPVVRDRVTNGWFNGLLYIVILAGVISLIISLISAERS